jgi:hypothetical protein
MLPYIYKPSLNFNVDEFTAFIRTFVTEYINDTRSMHVKVQVDEHRYLKDIQQAYPILSDTINIYVTGVGGGIPPHTDAARSAALNFPIQNTHESSTIFYQPDEELSTEFNSRFIWNTAISKITETFRFSMMTPIIINNSTVHSVEFYGDGCRIIASWSILPVYSFDQAVDFFNSRSVY